MHVDHATTPTAPLGVVAPEANDDLVLTPVVSALVERALGELEAGRAVHLAGPSGSGKSTVARHLAVRLGRPMSLIHDDRDLSNALPAGRTPGRRQSSMVDDYIASVLSPSPAPSSNGVHGRLADACGRGHTLICHGIDRWSAAAGGDLVRILEEGILNHPRSDEQGYIMVHPDFRLIITSDTSPGDCPVAMDGGRRDRLVTIQVDPHALETEIAVVMARSGLDADDAARLVHLSRALGSREAEGPGPGLGATIVLARVLVRAGVPVDARDDRFVGFAWDILGRTIRRSAAARRDFESSAIARLMDGPSEARSLAIDVTGEPGA